jgi:hypothetical protein
MSVSFARIGSYLDDTTSTLSSYFEKMVPETQIQVAKGVKLSTIALRASFLIKMAYQIWLWPPFPNPLNLQPWSVGLVASTVVGWLINDKMDDVIKKAQQKLSPPNSTETGQGLGKTNQPEIILFRK